MFGVRLPNSLHPDANPYLFLLCSNSWLEEAIWLELLSIQEGADHAGNHFDLL